MSTGYFMLALLWILYCLIHSVLISFAVSCYFKRFLGSGYRFYRMFFNLFSAISLIPLVVYSYSLPFRTMPLFAWSGHWRILQCCLIAVAVALLAGGARHYGILQFLGIQQIRSGTASGTTTGGGNLDTTGVLGMIRHPWYVAGFILLWAKDLNAAAITVNLVLSAYLVIGTQLEERKLVLEFGDDYRRYQDRVSMFLPLKWIRARLHC
jgi:protein-S-isoprenylcysteine O-methyltransferase Ste14